MNLSLPTFLFACLALSSSTHADVAEEIVHAEFLAWTKQHSKTYQTDDETKLRLGIWKQNNGEHLMICDSHVSITFTSLKLIFDEVSNSNIASYSQLQPAFIEAHNSKQPPPSYTLGHNQFSDLTVDEYQEFNKLGSYSPGLMTPFRARSNESVMTTTKLRKDRRLLNVPDSVDWVEKGAIVPVKNQGEQIHLSFVF